MKKRLLRAVVLGGLAVLCVAALILTGCPQPTDDGNSGGPSAFSAAPALTLAAGETAGSLVYSWAASDPAADGYDLYYAEGFLTDPALVKTGTRITGASSGGTLGGLSQGTIYSALITAYKEGYEAADTVIRYRTVPLDPTANAATGYADFEAAPVLTLAAGSDPSSLDYAWTASSPAAEFYTLYYVEGNVTDPAVIKAGTEMPWVTSGGTISGLTAGAVYSGILTARKSNYHASDSDPVQETASGLPALSVPTLTVTPGSGSLAFSWAHTSPTAGKYWLYYREGTFGDPADVKAGTSVDAYTNTDRDIRGLSPGAVYSALLRATKTGYTDSESAVVQTMVPPNPPVLTISADASSLTYTWTASAPAAATYDLYYVSGNETDPATVKAGTEITGASSGNAIGSLSAGDTYSFMVTANIADIGAVDSAVMRGTVEFAAPGAQENKTFSGVTLKFNYVPSGTFHYRVTAGYIAAITRGYWLGETAVSQELFQAVMGTNPSHFDGTTGKEPADGETQNKRPVEKVSWYAAIAFCNKLSLMDSKTPAYSVVGVSDWSTLAYGDIPTGSDAAWNAAALVPGANGYRLPTYMEWMWAAMGADKSAQPNTADYAKAFAGSTGSNSIGDFVWYSGNAGSKTHEAAQKTANELGLYDMSGNVYEWCTGFGVPTGTQTDYMGTLTGTLSTIVGGDWKSGTSYFRFTVTYSANKYDSSDNALGLRVLLPGQ